MSLAEKKASVCLRAKLREHVWLGNTDHGASAGSPLGEQCNTANQKFSLGWVQLQQSVQQGSSGLWVKAHMSGSRGASGGRSSDSGFSTAYQVEMRGVLNMPLFSHLTGREARGCQGTFSLITDQGSAFISQTQIPDPQKAHTKHFTHSLPFYP